MSAKKYQNVGFSELIAFAKNNPNRTRKLDSIEVLTTPQETSLNNFGLTGYSIQNLNPHGILSLLACIEDPNYYSLAQMNVRTTRIIDIATALQEETNNLKTTAISRKRKRIYDLIGASYNNSPFEDKDYYDLFNGLTHLRGLPFVLVKKADTVLDAEKKEGEPIEIKGEIIFSSDPCTWKNDPWIVDFRGQWVALPSDPSSKPVYQILEKWLCKMEEDHWFIKWHEVDATKVELVNALSQLPSWVETDRKLTKDVLSVRLGRYNTLNALSLMH
jgi:hypothetical protein